MYFDSWSNGKHMKGCGTRKEMVEVEFYPFQKLPRGGCFREVKQEHADLRFQISALVPFQ